jgi:fibronectin type 3 domain-containing protein
MKRLLLPIAALLLMSALAINGGCSEEITKPVRTDEVAGAPEVPRNLTTAVGNGRVQLSWEISDVAKISRYLIYRGDTTFAAPEVIDSTTLLSYNDTGLRNSLRYFYQVTAIGTNGLESEFSRAVSATPNIYGVQIEDNALLTNTRDVTISFAAPGGTSLVMIANDPNFSEAQWVNFSTSRRWQLTSGDGVKVVYAKFRDAEGNEVIGVVNDDITLDTRAEIASLTESSAGAILSAGDVVTFTLDGGEADGEASVTIEGVATIPLVAPTSGASGIYSADYTIPGGIDVIDAKITGNFRDAAGNEATALTASSSINIANPPVAAGLSAFVVSEESIELTWSRSTAADFQTYQVFRSETATVNSGSLLVRTESNAAVTTFRDSELEPAKEYYYIVITTDHTGLHSSSNIVHATTLANELPVAVSLFISNEDSVSVNLGWTQNSDTDFESYHIYRSATTPVQTNTTANLVGVITGQGQINFSDQHITVGEHFYYVVVVFDKYGARSANSNEVRGPTP